MAKKRKTRQEKISATLRHNENPVTYSLSSLKKPVLASPIPIITPVKTRAEGEQGYTFVRHDLLKTTLITGAIILTELALFFVLR